MNNFSIGAIAFNYHVFAIVAFPNNTINFMEVSLKNRCMYLYDLLLLRMKCRKADLSSGTVYAVDIIE